MDHSEAIGLMATEKYLLDELPSEVREQFEEHLFGCHECAMDIRAGSMFLEQGKAALADPETADGSGRTEGRRRFNWWRPAFAIPAMAVLLLVIGYQNFVTLPQLTRSLNKPRVLPATAVNLLTYGTSASPLVVHAGGGFFLNVIVPPGPRYPAYKVDLHSPAGGVESVAIAESASDNDTWQIQFPEASRPAGTYKLNVHGVNASGQDVEVGSASFPLQIQQ